MAATTTIGIIQTQTLFGRRFGGDPDVSITVPYCVELLGLDLGKRHEIVSNEVGDDWMVVDIAPDVDGSCMLMMPTQQTVCLIGRVSEDVDANVCRVVVATENRVENAIFDAASCAFFETNEMNKQSGEKREEYEEEKEDDCKTSTNDMQSETPSSRTMWTRYIRHIVAEYLEFVRDDTTVGFDIAIRCALSDALGEALQRHVSIGIAVCTFVASVMDVVESEEDKAIRCHRAWTRTIATLDGSRSCYSSPMPFLAVLKAGPRCAVHIRAEKTTIDDGLDDGDVGRSTALSYRVQLLPMTAFDASLVIVPTADTSNSAETSRAIIAKSLCDVERLVRFKSQRNELLLTRPSSYLQLNTAQLDQLERHHARDASLAVFESARLVADERFRLTEALRALTMSDADEASEAFGSILSASDAHILSSSEAGGESAASSPSISKETSALLDLVRRKHRDDVLGFRRSFSKRYAVFFVRCDADTTERLVRVASSASSIFELHRRERGVDDVGSRTTRVAAVAPMSGRVGNSIVTKPGSGVEIRFDSAEKHERDESRSQRARFTSKSSRALATWGFYGGYALAMSCWIGGMYYFARNGRTRGTRVLDR
eukprot:g5113.t1